MLLSVMTLLAACSEPQPDGHVYQMNGAGMTVPAAAVRLRLFPVGREPIFFRAVKGGLRLRDR